MFTCRVNLKAMDFNRIKTRIKSIPIKPTIESFIEHTRLDDFLLFLVIHNRYPLGINFLKKNQRFKKQKTYCGGKFPCNKSPSNYTTKSTWWF